MVQGHYIRIATFGIAVLFSGCALKPGGPEVANYKMGDRVPIGHLIYNVIETEWQPQLGEPPRARVPKDRFLVVRVSVVNSGVEDTSIPAFTLVDDRGQTYPELSDGEGVPQWLGILRRVKPTQSEIGNAIFDAPPRHYNLRITDESEQKIALVDIPLQFGTETREVILPQKK